MTNYENFYSGSVSSMSPEYSEIFTGYRLAPGRISSPTSIQTADQIREVSSRLSEGVKAVELQPISPEVFEAIPKQHMTEINRLTKLTGGEVSVHAPMIDPAGFTREGWSPSEREQAERHLISIVERVHALNPTGNVPVTIHASGTPGTEYAMPPPGAREQIVKGLMEERGMSRQQAEKESEKAFIIAVHQETGQMTPVRREMKVTPEHPTEYRWQAPVEIIDMINNGEWSSTLSRMQQQKKMADDLLEQGMGALQDVEQFKNRMETNELINSAKALLEQGYSRQQILSDPGFEGAAKGLQLIDHYSQAQEQVKSRAVDKLQKADSFMRDVMAAGRTAYNQAYKFGTEKQKDILKESVQPYSELNKKLSSGEIIPVPYELTQTSDGRLTAVRDSNGNPAITEKSLDNFQKYVRAESAAVDQLVFHGFASVRPTTYKPIEEFATEKSTQTLGNVAFNAYKKFGETAPLINIENLYSGMAFSRADDLKNLVEGARKHFVQQAVGSGMKEPEAKKAAEKMIGVTWDLGHASMLRKGGFTEKHLIEETKIIAPYVKHVHLADNFGFGDSHLPPGMATIPHKAMLGELEKAGFKGKAVIEAGAFVQHFKTSPHPFALEGLGSPIYSAQMKPFWNQARATYGGYFAGYGTMLPEQHFSMYGSGFSGIPSELGGQMPGKQSRFSGAPME